MPKTLQGKFTLLFAGLATLALLVGLAGIWNMYRIELSVDDLMTANYKSIDAVYRMMESLERQDSGMLISMAADEDNGLAIFTRNGNEFLKWYGIAQGNVTEAGESDDIGKIGEQYRQYQGTIFRLQELQHSARPEDARVYYSETVLPLVELIKSEGRQLIAINEQAMFRSKQKATTDAKQSMLALVLVTLAAAAGGYWASRYFIRLFLKPVRKLADGIMRVREGDLNQHVDTRSNDEAGQLAAEFNNMTRRLQEFERSSLGSLMAERNKSLAIVRSISDPLLVLDAHWRIQLANDACATFFGLDPSGVTGRHFLEAIPDGALFSELEKMASRGDAAEGKVVSLHKDRDYYFNLSVTTVCEPENGNDVIIVSLQNVTGFKELDRVKTDFVAAISHEFKTPLTSILMAASLLQEESMGRLTEEQTDTVETIRSDGDRLLELVNDLLDLMKLESGSDIYRLAPCSIYAIVDASLENMQEPARRKGILLTKHMPESLPEVFADSEKIQWVMNNLIGNAVKFSDSGDEVAISVGCESGYVTLAIQDTGKGIPQEFQHRIFEKYVQADGEGVEGKGLGLSIVREIIQSHGGNITVSSMVGAGSTFTVSLPTAKSGDRK